MISKFLEKKIEILVAENSGITGNTLELEYYLVESDNDMPEDMDTDKGYGVEIVKKEFGLTKESKMIKNIFCSRKTAEELLILLADNSVTPVTLPYILDDTMGI